MLTDDELKEVLLEYCDMPRGCEDCPYYYKCEGKMQNYAERLINEYVENEMERWRGLPGRI